MVDNDSNDDDGSDPLDQLGSDRHGAAAKAMEEEQDSDDAEPDANPDEGEGDAESGGDGESATATGDDDEDEDEEKAESDGGTTTESGSTSTGTAEPDSDEVVAEKPNYEAASVYLADPELTKYRHTFFKRLELDYPELQGCQQRELQRAVIAVALSDENREAVVERAVEYQQRREKFDQNK